MIDVLVADDEPLARETIKLLLKAQPDIGSVYEAVDGNQALALYKQYKPQLVFLDIQMPGKTGIQIAELLNEQSVIIFATAYDQYAITAFELNAIDYLLKPFDDERFYAALERGKRQLKERQIHDFKRVNELITLMQEEQQQQFKSRLVVKDPGRIRLVDVEQIKYIAGAGNYAEVHLLDGKHLLHRETLTSLEAQLDPKQFVRIHRSTIVRRSYVAELRPNEKGDYCVLLKTGEQLTLSRRNKNKLEELLND